MDDYLIHYGTPRHSGRYPFGSGERPYQSLDYKSKEARKTFENLVRDSKTSKIFKESISDTNKNLSRNNTRILVNTILANTKDLDYIKQEYIDADKFLTNKKIMERSYRAFVRQLDSDEKTDAQAKAANKFLKSIEKQGYKDFITEHKGLVYDPSTPMTAKKALLSGAAIGLTAALTGNPLAATIAGTSVGASLLNTRKSSGKSIATNKRYLSENEKAKKNNKRR